MKSIRNVDVLYTIHEKSRVLEECICRVESACDTGHFESVDSALRTKPELRAALGAYIRQMLALLGMLTPQAYSTASLDVRDIQDLLQALQWEPDRVSAFWPDLCDACRTLYRLSGEQLDIYVRLTQPAYAADFVPFPVSWTVKMKKKQKETQDILSYHTQAAGCSDKARAKASGGRQPIEECGRTGL